MQVLEKGHIYTLRTRTPQGFTSNGKVQNQLVFINKQPGQEHDGTTTQEVLRALIDRTRHCANCMPHRNNEQIVYHLRMALALHEARALERKIEKGDIEIEYVDVGADGHLDLTQHEPGGLDTTHLVPHRNDWDRLCNHPKAGE